MVVTAVIDDDLPADDDGILNYKEALESDTGEIAADYVATNMSFPNGEDYPRIEWVEEPLVE
jgi:hypothetical protein